MRSQTISNNAPGLSVSKMVSKKTPLVLIHPNVRSATPLWKHFLTQLDQRFIFVELTDAVVSVGQLWSLLAAAFEAQTETRLPPADSARTLSAYSKLLIQAFKEAGPLWLLVDSFDLADEDALCAWLTLVIQQLPVGCHLVLNSRRLSRLLLNEPRLAGKMTLYPIDSDKLLNDYLRQPADQVLVEVSALGAGTVIVNGKRITQWEGLLPFAMFFYFIDRGMMTRDEIFKTFWPELSKIEATNVFHVTKRKINELVGFEVTTYWSGFYRLSPLVKLHYDVAQFSEAIQYGMLASGAEALALFQTAHRVYRGTFLSTLTYPWATSRREQLSAAYADGLTAIAQHYEAKNDSEQALATYLRALNAQPQRDDLLYSAMTLFQAHGQPERAFSLYQRIVTVLKAQFDLAPQKRTIQLAEQLRKH